MWQKKHFKCVLCSNVYNVFERFVVVFNGDTPLCKKEICNSFYLYISVDFMIYLLKYLFLHFIGNWYTHTERLVWIHFSSTKTYLFNKKMHFSQILTFEKLLHSAISVQNHEIDCYNPESVICTSLWTIIEFVFATMMIMQEFVIEKGKH